MKKLYLGLIVLIAFTGCDQGNERLSEKASIEGKASTEASIALENQNLASKASQMEEDLSRRQNFYQAIKGTYEGSMQTELGSVQIRITLIPSLPPYNQARVRQLEEITADLNNLYLNAQIIQWNSSSPLSAVGCRISQIRPDILNGEINLVSDTCSNFYTVKISESGVFDQSSQEFAVRLASEIIEGRTNQVRAIVGSVSPSTNASVYRLSAIRKDN